MTIFKKLTLSLLISSVAASGNISIAKSKANLPLDEIHNFVDVYNAIKTEYVTEQEGEKLIDLAIKGMLKGLDPHSNYLKADELKNFSESSSGSYVGFGVQLDMVSGKLIIVAAIPGSPADKANLQSGDIIAAIDGTVIDDLSMKEAMDMLKEKEKVVFTIISKGHKSRKVTVTKSTVVLPSVTDKILDKNYGYIRITQFQKDTGKHFEKSLTKLVNKKVKGVVLDLRDNPGGLLTSATIVADSFLDAGLIVSTKNDNTDSEDKTHANKETITSDLPLVVLINKGSASASELVAGALQDHKRAVVVGQTSFGKGSVQNVIPLSNGAAVKMTIAYYYTPNGTSIQAKGITPDIMLAQLKVDESEENVLSYGESDITGHLVNPKKKPETKKTKDGTKKGTESKETKETNKNKESKTKKKITELLKKNDKNLSDVELAKTDLQLFEALNVLKVLNLKSDK